MNVSSQAQNSAQQDVVAQVSNALAGQPALANWFQQLMWHYQSLQQDVTWLTEITAGIDVTIQQGIAAGMKWKMYPAFPLYFPRGITDLFFQLIMQQVLGEGERFFDVGANAGFHSLAAAACVGSSGQVTAFEPLASNVSVLKTQIELNALENCEVIAAAVGGKDGKMRFYEQADNALGSTIPAKQAAKSTATTKVKAIQLDTYIGDDRPPTLVKIDVEGAEADVLVGAEKMLAAEQAPVLMIELHDGAVAEKVFQMLVAADYGIYTMASNPVIHSAALSPTAIRHVVAARHGDMRLPMVLPQGKLAGLVPGDTPLAKATLQG